MNLFFLLFRILEQNKLPSNCKAAHIYFVNLEIADYLPHLTKMTRNITISVTTYAEGEPVDHQIRLSRFQCPLWAISPTEVNIKGKPIKRPQKGQ